MDSSLPQGSTLGPLTYITCASEQQRLLEDRESCSTADDTQLSKATRVEDFQAAKQAAVNCINSIQDWSSSQRLKLNAAKSEVITRQQLAKLSEAHKMLQIDNTVLKPSTVVRNLDVVLLMSSYRWMPALVSVRRLVSSTCCGSANCIATSTMRHRTH